MIDFLYRVEGPDLFGESFDTAGWGIEAQLGNSFAEKLMRKKRIKVGEERLQEEAKIILSKGGFPKYKRKDNHYLFYEDTCLVQSIYVPGNACDLALDEDALRNLDHFRREGKFMGNLWYVQHNVDLFQQAVFLEILFRKWANQYDFLMDDGYKESEDKLQKRYKKLRKRNP